MGVQTDPRGHTGTLKGQFFFCVFNKFWPNSAQNGNIDPKKCPKHSQPILGGAIFRPGAENLSPRCPPPLGRSPTPTACRCIEVCPCPTIIEVKKTMALGGVPGLTEGGLVSARFVCPCTTCRFSGTGHGCCGETAGAVCRRAAANPHASLPRPAPPYGPDGPPGPRPLLGPLVVPSRCLFLEKKVERVFSKTI